MILRLSWPNKALSPNSRAHWAAKAKAAKVAHWEGYFEALSKLDGELKRYPGKMQVTARFFPKTRNYPDADNCLASIKHQIDGIADALQVNDRQFLPKVIVDEKTGGFVEIIIERAA